MSCLKMSFSGWFEAAIGYVWLLLMSPIGPISASSVQLIFFCHMQIFVIFNKRLQFFVRKVVLKILMIKNTLLN